MGRRRRFGGSRAAFMASQEITGPTWSAEKEALLDHPPHEVQLWLKIPDSVSTLRQLNSLMKRTYGLDVGYDKNDEEGYEKIFYNPDLRSLMGTVWDFEGGAGEVGLVIWPTYWVGWEHEDDYWSGPGERPREHTNKSDYYTKMWKKMLENSRLGPVA